MPLQKNQILTLRIERLSSDGSGVAHSADGEAVFVPGTAPGDEARVRIVKARLRKVLTNGGGTYSMSTATKNATVCWNLCWTTPRSSFWKTPLNGSGFCRKRR